ncbi:MAG: xanthine dehydrogenase accessory protein XdhC [Woeseiaceae bacterium]
MNEWIEELSDLTAAGEAVVLVTVAGVRGSGPREPGARMIVTPGETIGTIGGGQLEYQCTRIAVDMLDGDEIPALRKFPLGASMGQCCGGVVDMLFEPFVSGLPEWLRDLRALHGQRRPAVLVVATDAATKFVVTADEVFGEVADDQPAKLIDQAREILERRESQVIEGMFFGSVVGSDFNIAVFGAGHVGTAVVNALSGLDCNIRWIDSRRDVFRSVPRNARAIEAAEPALEAAALPPGSCYLVMTHSHPLDFEICDRILRRDDAAYCGLIGSMSKRRRFEKRFRQQGLSQAEIDKLVCPIGVDGISGKKPAEIAIAAAAEVLRAYEQSRQEARDLPDNVRPIRS